MPRIPGGDIAGVVHSVGAGVAREWVGRRVLIDPHIKPGGALGEHANGGLCERIAMEAENLIHMPDAVTFEQAASLPIAYGTAYRMMITRGQLQGRRAGADPGRERRRRHRLRADRQEPEGAGHRLRVLRRTSSGA